jgi:uncharacterized protein YuzB (UPF0349 family)
MPTSTRVIAYVKKCEKKLKEGGDQTCRICNVTKSIELFERPFLTMCKSCAADKATKTVECDVCHKVVQYGNYAKHKKTKRCLASVVVILMESCRSNCEAKEAKFRSEAVTT